MTRRHALCGFCLVLLATSACFDSSKKPRESPPQVVLPPIQPGDYADGPPGLRRLWGDILQAAQKDQREKVLHLLGSLGMSKAELASLLGPEKAAALWPRYQAILSDLTHLGGLQLVDTIARSRFDQIEILPIATRLPAEQSDTEQRVQRALLQKTPMYTVRLDRSEESPSAAPAARKSDPPLKAIRYEFFVYLNGYWRTGGLLGQELPKLPSAEPPVLKPPPPPPT